MLKHRYAAFAFAALLFAGAGCDSVANDLANDAVKPVDTSLEALAQAKELAADQTARANEQAEAESNDVSIALIVTDGGDAGAHEVVGGTIGCNDRVAFAKLHRSVATGRALSDALTTLLAQSESTVDGLYNSLWQSPLTLEDVRSTDGVTTEVLLKGEVRHGGVCDVPRVKAQVEKTVARFRAKYRILLNGSERNWRCLGDQSGQCK